MSTQGLQRSVVAGVVGLALIASAGCTALLEGVAEEYGPKSGPAAARLPAELTPDQPPRDALAPASSRPTHTQVVHDYQSAPTIDWRLYRYGPPFSISRALFERGAPVGPVCRAAPISYYYGIRSWLSFGSAWRSSIRHPDLNSPGSSVSRPVSDTGRFERELAYGDVDLGTLFSGDRNALTARYLASAARLGHQGHACGESLSVSLWWSSDGTDVTLLR